MFSQLPSCTCYWLCSQPGHWATTNSTSSSDTQLGDEFGTKKNNVVGAHDIVRKQSENTCSPYSDEYYRRIAVLHCNAEYIRAVREEIGKATCDSFHYELRQHPFYDCGTNHNRTFCAEFNEVVYGNGDRYSSDVFDQCFNPSRPPSADNCEIGCKRALQQLADQIGLLFVRYHPDALTMGTCDIRWPQPCSDTPQPIKAPDDVTQQCSFECLLSICTVRINLRR